MREKFRGKPFKLGDSTVVTVPKFLMKERGIEEGKEYVLTISDEVADNEQQ